MKSLSYLIGVRTRFRANSHPITIHRASPLGCHFLTAARVVQPTHNPHWARQQGKSTGGGAMPVEGSFVGLSRLGFAELRVVRDDGKVGRSHMHVTPFVSHVARVGSAVCCDDRFYLQHRRCYRHVSIQVVSNVSALVLINRHKLAVFVPSDRRFWNPGIPALEQLTVALERDLMSLWTELHDWKVEFIWIQKQVPVISPLSLVHTYEINTGVSTSVSTRMFTLATCACLVRVTSETFSSAIFIDREEIWNISHSDWLNSCSYACAYFTPVPKSEISV